MLIDLCTPDATKKNYKHIYTVVSGFNREANDWEYSKKIIQVEKDC